MPIIIFNDGSNSSGGSGVMTLDNGLTLTGTNGQLGGTLVQSTVIPLAGFLFLLGTGANAFFIDDSGNEINASVGSGSDAATVQITPGDGIFNVTNAIGTQGFEFNTLIMSLEDEINNQGFVNAGDYEANFVARSLITKQYGDANYGNGVVASDKVAGVMASENLIVYTVPGSNDLLYNISGSLDCILAGAGAAGTIYITWTNSHGDLQSNQSTVLSTTLNAGVSTNGYATSIYAKGGTTITVSYELDLNTATVNLVTAIQLIV